MSLGNKGAPEVKKQDHDEKNRRLYERQKNLLDTFLAHGAISKQQHDKSLKDLTEKMHLQDRASEDTGRGK
ncbi:MAG: hypothetical protein IIY39_04230 [Firmicutes bacterium]|nr:hypothetical protein [Bacillota bacterium]